MPLPDNPQQSDPEKASLFVNIVIHDASEAIKEKVRESFHHLGTVNHDPSNDDSNTNNRANRRKQRVKAKVFDVAHKLMSTGMKQSIANTASHAVAIDFDYSERLTAEVSATICQEISAILRLKGITGLVRPAHIQGPYLVLELQVQHVDTNVFDMYGEDTATSSNNSNASASSPSASAVLLRTLGQMTPLVEQDFLPHMVQSHLFHSLQSTLQKELSENLLVTDTIIVPEQYQARYFYSYAQELTQYQKLVLRELAQGPNKREQTPVPPPLPILHQAWRL